MTEGSTVVPRVRARRKKRKPPGPGFWFFAGMALIDLGVAAYDVMRIASGRPAFVIALGFAALALAFAWPRFLREWDAWRRDNDE